jgi:hypothetical protein
MLSVTNTSAHQDQMNLVFANRSKEDAIYPLTVQEIAQAPKLMPAWRSLKTNIQHNWSRIPRSYARIEKWTSL